MTVSDPPESKERAWSRSEFMRVANIVHELAGISFPPNRRASAEAGMQRVMKKLGITEPVGLEIGVSRGGAVMEALLDDLTIGESYFFREPAQFRFIADELLPQWSAEWPLDRQIKIWSAGCAAGQEAYSAAIMLRENKWQKAARILGTDISEGRLKDARIGDYSKWSLRTLPQETIARWFTQKGARYQVDPVLKQNVEFSVINLLDPEPKPESMGQDVIFCRNVLIYFELSAIAFIAERLLDSLAPGGWLFVGASDPHLAEIVPCEVVLLPGATGYRKSAGSVTTFALRQAPLTLLIPEERKPQSVVAYTQHDIAAGTDFQMTPPEHRIASDDVAATSGPAEAVALARLLANEGRLEEAGQVCASALELFPDQAELHLIDAILGGEAGRWKDSERAARRAIYLDRALVVAHVALGDAQVRLGNPAGARLSFANAGALLDQAGDDAEIRGSAGMSAERLLDLVRAHLSLLDSAGSIPVSVER